MTNRRSESTGILIASTIAALLSATPTTGQEATVEGTLIANGKDVQLPYVYVREVEGFHDEADPAWEIIFAAQPIEERSLGEFFLDFPYLKVSVTRSGAPHTGAAGGVETFGQNLKLSKDHPNFSGNHNPKVEMTEAGPDRFTGRVWTEKPEDFFDDTWQYDLRFSAPLSHPKAP